ncbi:hypothetical protein [Streptomyces sp. NPDC012888]|uniref:hypothetical protein n=1 Tax=Streptomyces sp. NPDC012888 TaxID=3364855 RepID=UPI00368C0D7F
MNGATRLRTALALAAALLAAAAPPAAASGDLITVIDNSHSDSVVEIDRTGNLQTGSGTSGSDHDGTAVDMLATLVSTVHRDS